MDIVTLGLGLVGLVAFGVVGLKIVFLRRVVPTNEVHIVQSRKATISYGKDTSHGNTYYEWPSYLPFIGLTKVILPTNNFTLKLDGYEAYDKGRLPFLVDIAAFFVIKDTNTAAQRISSTRELTLQLEQIVQGAVRTILASSDLEDIMQGRSTFGEQFTKEVKEQLAAWGVETVKNMELMDIRDAKDSQVIKNIMDKKKSYIEMQSRTEVALNKQKAQVAEIDAQRQVDLQKQEATQTVGLRTIAAEQAVQVSKQEALQLVKEQERLTKDKEMAVIQVEQVRRAEIDRSTQIIKAEQDKQTAVIKADAHKQSTTLVAEGQLEAKKREAEGIAVEGTARADAEKAMQLAPVQAQITLAKEIGGNREYQEYLVTIEKIHAAQEVGKEQAKALQQADIKVITNSGAPTSGLTNVMDLFSSKGGTEVGSMLEALSNTEKGADLLGKFLPSVAPAVKPAKSNGTSGLSNGKAN